MPCAAAVQLPPDGWRSSKRTKVQGVSSKHSVSRSRTRRTPSFPVFVPPSSPRSRRLARTEAALPGPCQRPRAAADSQVIRGKCRGSSLQPCKATSTRASCCLTLRSRRRPPAGHWGRDAPLPIMLVAAPMPCRCPRLSSNVRQQVRRVCEFTNATAKLGRRTPRKSAATAPSSAAARTGKGNKASSTEARAHRNEHNAGHWLRARRLSVSNQTTPELSGCVPPPLPRSCRVGYQPSCLTGSLPPAATAPAANPRQVAASAGASYSGLASSRPLGQAAA